MAEHDDISGVFDDLDPAQFYFADSAAVQMDVEPTDFMDFIGVHRLILKAQFAAAGGRPNPVIFLEGGTTLRGYVAQDRETMTEFTARLATEAREMGAKRLFFYRRTMIAALPHGSNLANGKATDSIDGLAPANEPLLHDGVLWYAEQHTGDQVERLGGTYELSGSERLIDTKMVSEQAIDVLKDILGG